MVAGCHTRLSYGQNEHGNSSLATLLAKIVPFSH